MEGAAKGTEGCCTRDTDAFLTMLGSDYLLLSRYIPLVVYPKGAVEMLGAASGDFGEYLEH